MSSGLRHLRRITDAALAPGAPEWVARRRLAASSPGCGRNAASEIRRCGFQLLRSAARAAQAADFRRARGLPRHGRALHPSARASWHFMAFSTSAKVAMVTSPGVVMAKAPWAAPHSTRRPDGRQPPTNFDSLWPLEEFRRRCLRNRRCPLSSKTRVAAPRTTLTLSRAAARKPSRPTLSFRPDGARGRPRAALAAMSGRAPSGAGRAAAQPANAKRETPWSPLK